MWPWLADRYGRRTLLAINIALFSLLMPITALTTTFTAFVAVRCAIHFALNGEWSLGSMLVAETWPASMRGRVIGINRGTWCFGAALAGAVATFVMTEWGWRIACVIPAVVALLAGLCPHRIAGVTVLGAPAGSAAADPRGRQRANHCWPQTRHGSTAPRRLRCANSSCRIC